MYSVVIVDDEHWVRKVVRRIVRWEDYGFEIVGESGNGKQALELIRECRPDLVFTDIRMPGMDGIELIRIVREEKIPTEFVIISGYNEFDYAQSAIKYGVVDYLLKPLNETDISSLLTRMSQQIRQEISVKNDLAEIRAKRLEEILDAVLKDEKSVTLEEFNQRSGTHFAEGTFLVALLRWDRDSGPGEESRKQNVLDTWIQSCSALFHDYSVLPPSDADEETLLILNYLPDREKEVQKALDQLADMGRSCLPCLSVTGGIGVPGSFGRLKSSYESALNALRTRVIFGTGKMIRAAEHEHRMSWVRRPIPIREEKKLLLSLELGDEAQTVNQAVSVFRSAADRIESNLLSYHLVGCELLSLFVAASKRKGIQDIPKSEQEYSRMLDQCARVSEMEAVISEAARDFSGLFQSLVSNEDKIISTIKQYVSAHYREEISLDDLARLVFLSPNYVSELFKKQSGENFSEYLMDYRIKIAMDLLRDIQYRVVDVSEMVGYQDAKYFSRLFKKRVGMNPNTYRKLYS